MEVSVTGLIAQLQNGDRGALDQLVPIVYTELHKIAEFLPDSVHRVRHEMRLALAWLHREVAG